MTTASVPVTEVRPNILPRWKDYWRFLPGTRKQQRALAKSERRKALALRRIQ